jgi:hypothetical protein
MKMSVTSVDCLMTDLTSARVLFRSGSAFFFSESGDFLTAAHVIVDLQRREPPCPTAAAIISLDAWRPESPDEPMLWFPFDPSLCKIDKDADLAACALNQDLKESKLKSRIVPVKFEWSVPPDSTQVAFTGFPMNARDPMTIRSSVAAIRIPWQEEKPIPELVLDHNAWPGHSGSPVYLSDGRVIGILIAHAKGASEMTVVRPASLVRDMVTEKLKK